ncbi:MAG: ABC transporter permease [Gemmiger sp.]|nr:ABC transporter permease [Gemmiger sp.]
MGKLIKTEIWKLKRYSVLKAGLAMGALSTVLAVALTFANDGTVWNISLFLRNILLANCTYFSPIIFALLGGNFISREFSGDTLKAIQTIPVSYRKLLAGKLVVLAGLALLFGVESYLLGVLAAWLLGISMGAGPLLLAWALRIILANVLVAVAVAPIVLLTASATSASLVGTALAFVYGYFGNVEWQPLNYHPIKAILILLDPECGTGFDFIHYQPLPAALSLAAALLITCLLLAIKGRAPAAPRAAMAKNGGRQVRAKGWS